VVGVGWILDRRQFKATRQATALQQFQHNQMMAVLTSPTPPAWAPDPTGRHHQRWWNGNAWSNHVADVHGKKSIDKL